LSSVLRSALLVLFLWMIRGVAVPIALGALFALLLSPLAAKMKPRLGRLARQTPLFLTLGTLLLVVIPFTFFVVKVVQSVNEFLARDWAPTITRLRVFLTNGIDIRGRSIHIGGTVIQTAIENVGQRVADFVATTAADAATAVPEVMLDLFLFAVALFYFLRDGEMLIQFLYRLSPFPKSQTRALFASVRDTVNGAILGLVATSLVQGGLTLFALYIFGVPNAFLLGVLATVLSFLPIMGTTPVTFGSALYLFVTGHIGAGVGMVIAAFVVGIADNVVRPWVQSSQSSAHPLLALLGIFGGLEVFGASGVFLGPVIAAMAFWTLENYAKLHPAPEATPPPVESP